MGAGMNGRSRAKKVWLNVPFADNAEAKAAGAHWDGKARSWYVWSNAKTDKVERWLYPEVVDKAAMRHLRSIIREAV